MWKTSTIMPDNVEILNEKAVGDLIVISYAMRFKITHENGGYKYYEQENEVTISKRLARMAQMVVNAMYNKMKASVEAGL
jgi:phage pi2 protein 07